MDVKKFSVQDLQRMKNSSSVSPIIPNRQGVPGSKFGMTMDKVKQFDMVQKRSKGFRIPLSANTITETQIVLSGTAQLFLGINMFLVDAANTCLVTLTINNDKIIDSVIWYELTNNAPLNSYDKEYFEYPRFLGGNDNIILSLNSSTGTTAFPAFYFI